MPNRLLYSYILVSVLIALCAGPGSVTAQRVNQVDLVRPDAPELAAFGPHDIGVRTVSYTDTGRIDILSTQQGGETAYYDRTLTVEIWYPAQLAVGQKAGGTYSVMIRDLSTGTLHGRAVRDAGPLSSDERYPLVIVSHGYPGNRHLMTHLAENLASKGYVVASIDHKDSTYDDRKPFASTLYNRPLDQTFVIDSILDPTSETSAFLVDVVDTERAAIIGYSMGGYGLVNNVGGGFSDEAVASEFAPPNGLLERFAASQPKYREALDSRIKAGVAIAPWGMTPGYWRPEDLASIQTPTLYIVGSMDRTSGYEKGVRVMFEHATGCSRYLLTYQNAGHNIAAPMPVPVEIMQSEEKTGAGHYTDPVWDTLRANNIAAHFVTAFLDHHLKGNTEASTYLDLVPNSNDGVYSMKDHEPTDTHTYWKGFGRGTANGLLFEHLPANAK